MQQQLELNILRAQAQDELKTAKRGAEQLRKELELVRKEIRAEQKRSAGLNTSFQHAVKRTLALRGLAQVQREVGLADGFDGMENEESRRKVDLNGAVATAVVLPRWL